jgi:hypothetical protein
VIVSEELAIFVFSIADGSYMFLCNRAHLLATWCDISGDCSTDRAVRNTNLSLYTLLYVHQTQSSFISFNTIICVVKPLLNNVKKELVSDEMYGHFSVRAVPDIV